MKLTINYTGDEKGFDLEQDLTANIEVDAKALGYIANVLFETANVLAAYLKKTNPRYHLEISSGVAYSQREKEVGGNTVYPFTTFIIVDEKQ